jgi:hypothetical protein
MIFGRCAFMLLATEYSIEKLLSFLFLGILSVLVLLSSYLSMPMSESKQSLTLDPDCFHNITQLIANKGYPWEEHKVITLDGYILGVYCIPHG